MNNNDLNQNNINNEQTIENNQIPSVPEQSLATPDNTVTQTNVEQTTITPTPEVTSAEAINPVSNTEIVSQEQTSSAPNTDVPSKPKGGFNPIILLVIIIILGLCGYFGYNKFIKKDTNNKVKEQEQSYKKVYEDKRLGTSSPIRYYDKNYETYLELMFRSTYTLEVYDESIGDIDDIDNPNANKIFMEIVGAYSLSCSNYLKSLGQSTTILDAVANTSDYDFVSDINKELEKYDAKYKITKLKIDAIDYTEESDTYVRSQVENSIDNTDNANTPLVKQFDANIKLYTKEEGGRHTPAFVEAGWTFIIDNSDLSFTGEVSEIEGTTMMMPGEEYKIKVSIDPVSVSSNSTFKIIENDKTIGEGTITSIYRTSAN